MKKIIANKIWSIFILSCWLVLAINVNFLGIIEGYINPVIKNVSILSFNDSKVYGNLDKLRNCRFVGMEWYILNDYGEYKKVTVKLPDNVVNFYEGNHIFGPMELLITKDKLEHSMVRVFHDCDEHIFTNNVISIVKIDVENKRISMNISD